MDSKVFLQVSSIQFFDIENLANFEKKSGKTVKCTLGKEISKFHKILQKK